MIKERITDYEESLATIEEAAGNLFRMGRMFRPMFPWVFVYVLQKEQKSGQIILPTDQNKPMHEAIVLATWEKNTRVDKKNRLGVFESELTAGDHVLIHHWAGYPISNYDAKRFRLVRELDWHETKQGGIVGVIEHLPTSERENLLELVSHQNSEWDGDMEKITDTILQRYILVDKKAGSVTLSGV